eukprot:4114245-Heterocapsa_arctica.AAC.1
MAAPAALAAQAQRLEASGPEVSPGLRGLHVVLVGLRVVEEVRDRLLHLGNVRGVSHGHHVARDLLHGLVGLHGLHGLHVDGPVA